MPPKFQSSFIPKGPLVSGLNPTIGKVSRPHDLLAILAKGAFALSVVAAILATGYKFYINYSIKEMSAEIERAREELAQGPVGELISLNDRISSASTLVSEHRVVSPIFAFFEAKTPRAVRLNRFEFDMAGKGPALTVSGLAQGYSALAFFAETVYKEPNFREPVFSNIALDTRGNVTFNLTTKIDPTLISYQKSLNRQESALTPITPSPAPSLNSSTSTATSTNSSKTSSSTPTN